jgi:8-oxo-dGTP pyrophosphatase MutT (NUDIX family)
VDTAVPPEVIPRPAATINVPGGTVIPFEVLMVWRREATFMGGAYVFPGGALDLDDAAPGVGHWCGGRATLPRCRGEPHPAELAEEVGSWWQSKAR